MWDLGPELRDKWEINRNEIQLIRKLGHGNFGEVYYGKWRNKIEVAVKTLRPGTMSTEAFLQVNYSLQKMFWTSIFESNKSLVGDQLSRQPYT